jgi:hypothetical protein
MINGQKFKELLKRIRTILAGLPEVKFALVIFMLLFTAAICLDIFIKNKSGFGGNIISEVHGLLFDILVFGIMIIVFNRLIEIKRDIKRWQEEIDDLRYWDEKEATFRIVGSIKRLNKAGVSRIYLYECFLRKAMLDEANLAKALLMRADLQEAQLIKARLCGANLSGAKLHGAKLLKAEMTDVDAKGADFSGALLDQANLDNADLRRADFKGSELIGTSFKNASLYGADFREAFFSDANLTGVDFTASDFRDARDLTIDQLSQARTLYSSKLDPWLLAEIRTQHPHLLEKIEGKS